MTQTTQIKTIGEEAAQKIGELFGRTKAFKANIASIIDRIVAERKDWGSETPPARGDTTRKGFEATLRALKHRLSQDVAWYLHRSDKRGEDDYWWVTDFTYEQIEGNRRNCLEMIDSALDAASNLHAQQTPAVAREKEE